MALEWLEPPEGPLSNKSKNEPLAARVEDEARPKNSAASKKRRNMAIIRAPDRTNIAKAAFFAVNAEM